MSIKNKNSQLVYDVDEALEMLLSGNVHGDIIIGDEDELEKFNKYQTQLSGDVVLVEEDTSDDFHEVNTSKWNIPSEYLDIDIEAYLFERCTTEIEVERIAIELEEFKRRDLLVVLNLMVYLVDYFKQNDIVWGVGRGSSAASYSLYLIGINRVNSLEYDLDIKEFFK